MTAKLFVDIIGWIGSFEIILAYALNSAQKIDSKSMHYQMLNLTGGAFLIVNTVYYGAFPSAFINVVWFIIAALAIINVFRQS